MSSSAETALVEGIRAITIAGHEIVVTCDKDYGTAGLFLNDLKEREKTARAFFEPMVKAAYKAHKEVKARENEVVLPLAEAKKALGAEMGRYQTRVEAGRERERIQLQEEADERALVDAARLEKKAEEEKSVKMAEAARLEEADKPEEAAGMERAARLAETAWLKMSEKALDADPVILTTIVPKIAGTANRTFWKFKIIDEAKIPREYLCVDEKAIGEMVRTQKDRTSIPGVRAYPDTRVV